MNGIRTGLILAAVSLFLFAAVAGAAPVIIGEKLQPVLAETPADELIPVVALMSPRHDVEELTAMVQGLRADERKAVIWDEVRTRADLSQDAALDYLYAQEQLANATSIRSLKMANAIGVHATAAVIEALAGMENVRAIHYTPARKVVPDPPDQQPVPGGELDELAWGIETVNAQAVWDMGYSGAGVLVAVIDTGINYNHVDLADHLWDGGPEYPNHGYDFYNNDNNPVDDNGHGTHVSGTVCGDGTGGTQTGVAPDATLMGLKVFNSWGSGEESMTWDALDFCLQQGVDVTSLSAGWTDEVLNLRATFRDNYDILNAAGIVSIVAAGNEGNWQDWYPIPDNVRTPGNVPPPWLHEDQTEPGEVGGVITAGATDQNDNIADFSSRGPVTWENVDPYFDFVYNGGQNQGLLKPDLSAPGVDVKSLSYTDNDGYVWNGWSGTSMATPHISGTACLLFEINENLTPAEVNEALEMGSVDYGTPGKDNTFGTGRLDSYESALLAEEMGSIVTINIDPEFDPYVIPGSGGTMTFDVSIRNNLVTPANGQVWTEAILPDGSTYQIQTYNVTLQPDVDIDVFDAEQYVPAGAPDGEYLFVIKIGLYPNFVVDEDSFEFIKITFDPDGGNEWTSRGLDQLAGDASAEPLAANVSEFALGEAYPNPFNPATTISLALPEAGDVRVAVFNALGREVAELQNGRLAAGEHAFTFDASGLASGIYFVRATAGAETAMRKIVLMK
ncbi:MAG: Bacillopeptidase F [Calditrichaeota bacterium]|nr:Bacillopeptidase F [Calditrichota bacterium]